MMKTPKFTGQRWRKAEEVEALKQNRTDIVTEHGRGNSMVALRARIDRLEIELGLVPPPTKTP